MRPRLYIMAKAPVMGRAKTRLAADIGVTHAKRIYRAMMTKVLRNVQDPRWETVMAVTPPSALGQYSEWSSLPQTAQVSGSLSPRLANLFQGCGPIIIIGTDCPQVQASDIAEAVKALRTHKAVFGPALDGGFWLIAMHGPVAPETFDGVRWSHPQTLKDMRSRIDGPIYHLRALSDVDDKAALNRVMRGA